MNEINLRLISQDEKKRRRGFTKDRVLFFVCVSIAGMVVGAYIFYQSIPPARNIVATYKGGKITIEQLSDHIAMLSGTEQVQRKWTTEELRFFVEDMVSDEIAKMWGKSRNIEKEETIGHLMTHVNEDINLNTWHDEMHRSQMGINESDIAAYYEANRQQFGEKTLSESRDDIVKRLKEKGEDQFVENYVVGLKNNASIVRNYELLIVPTFGDQDIYEFYQRNKENFRIPSRAVVDELRIDASDGEKIARLVADRILSRVREGKTVAEAIRGEERYVEFSEGITISNDGSEISNVVFALEKDQISEPIVSGEFMYINKLITKDEGRTLQLKEVADKVRLAVEHERQNNWFLENKDREIFSVDGKRLTAGEFWNEYNELPVVVRDAYNGVAGMQALAEKLIERYLVSRESSIEKKQEGSNGRLEESRLKLVTQMMEKEEIDDKVSVSDAEISSYYNKNKAKIVSPPRSQIRQIKIRIAGDEKKSVALAEKAYKQLVPAFFSKPVRFESVAVKVDSDALALGQWSEEPIWVSESQFLENEVVNHEYHEKILAIKKGRIGKPFVYGESIFIVQVLDRTKPRRFSLVEVKELIKERLSENKHRKLAENLSKKLLSDYETRIYDSVLFKYTNTIKNEEK